MRLKILVSASLVTTLCLASAVRAKTPVNLKQQQAVISAHQPFLIADESGWKEISSAEGRFTVLMPGTPSEDKKEGSFTAKTQSGVFTVAYKDFAEEVSQTTPDELLEQVSQGLATDGSKLLSKRKISLSGYPGREVKYEDSDKLVGIIRIYLVKERLYLNIVIPSTAEDTNKFFDSFRLTQR